MTIQATLRPASRADSRAVALLASCGAVLLVVCLFWNRISLGGRYGLAPSWIHDLARPITVVHEALLGPLASDAYGEQQSHRIAQLVGSWTVAIVAYFAGVWLVLRRPGRVGPAGLDVILLVSIVCRIVLVFSPPCLETDPNRYLWDGAVLSAGINPYKYAPSEVTLWRQRTAALASDRHPSFDARSNAELGTLARLSERPDLSWPFLYINHPDAPTLYPPVAQHLFSVAARISPGNVLVEKALVVLVDLGILWLLGSLLTLLGRPAPWVLLYGWCPMVLKEYAQTGHYDVLATFCLLGSLHLLLHGRRVLAGVYLGLAALGKLFPLVAAVPLFRRYRPVGLAAIAATLVLFWAPFLDIGTRAFDGLAVYSRDWVMNASVFSALRATLFPGSTLLAKLAVALLFGALLLALARRTADDPATVVDRVYVAVGALFLLSPVGNPWYCGWVLPLAALGGRVSWVVLSGTMVAYYVFWGFRSYLVAPWPGGPPVDLRILEYLPFFVVLACEEWRGRRRDPRDSIRSATRTP